MHLALLSDIHGNMHALDAFLADITARGDCDAVVHLGDLVGYGAHPNEVVARLRARGIIGVAGNYDTTVAHGHDHCGCRVEDARQEALAHESFAFTCRVSSDQTKRALAALPFRLDLRPLGAHQAGPTVTLLHAHPTNALVYVTEDRPDAFLTKMAELAGRRAGDVIAFGHTHKPWHRTVDGILLVNTGSVGRPKDGDPRACYVRLDISEHAREVEFRRVAYDVESAAAALLAAGLPADFADFLRTGGSPT